MNFRSRLRQDPIGFQIAPMIDVVFLLLCFFITSQIYAHWEREMNLTLPTASSGTPPRRLPGELILNIRANGTVTVNGQEFDDAALATMLKRLVEVFPGQPISLRGDENTPYKHIIRVIDRCREADLWNLSFATGMPAAPGAAPAATNAPAAAAPR